MKGLKKFICIIYILIFAFLSYENVCLAGEYVLSRNQTATASTPPEDAPDIYSEAAIVMDAVTGQILYEKNAYATMYPASITKILTTLVALENSNLDDIITMSDEAVYGIEWDSSHISLKPGEQITVRDALYATMLSSANEAAWGVAEYVGGDLDTFCDMMNKKAKELGCIGTNFVNANGLHNDNHYTCAYDMALITKAALTNPQFVEIASTKYYTIDPTSYTPETRYLVQGNKMLFEDSEYYYQGCYGGKTGYTNMAQGTLVTWCERDGIKLICVTMKSSLTAYKYMDTKALFDYCYDKYEKAEPLATFQFTKEDIDNTENFLNQHYNCENLGTLNLNVDTGSYVLISRDISSGNLTTSYEMSESAVDSLICGYVNICYGETILHSVPVTYSGYINSTDEAAVAAAMADGIIKKPSKFNFGKLIIFTVIIACVCFAGFCYYKRMVYIKRKREEYIKRRDKARRNGQSF